MTGGWYTAGSTRERVGGGGCGDGSGVRGDGDAGAGVGSGAGAGTEPVAKLERNKGGVRL